MAKSSWQHQRFLAELKRRRVFRVMAVCGAVGFVLLQIVDLAVTALLLPEWTYRFVALILLLGFPASIVRLPAPWLLGRSNARAPLPPRSTYCV